MISVDNRKKVYSNVLKIKLHYKDFRKKNKYNEYKKSGKKPSIFCKDFLN